VQFRKLILKLDEANEISPLTALMTLLPKSHDHPLSTV